MVSEIEVNNIKIGNLKISDSDSGIDLLNELNAITSSIYYLVNDTIIQIFKEMKKKIKEIGVNKFIKYKEKEYPCTFCKGIIYFYYYKCSKCGKEAII